MLRISQSIVIDENELREDFIRSSGPGGQHADKASTAVKLCFDAARSPSIPEDVRKRLMQLAGKRINEEGIIVIDARRFRSQEQNRRDARARLFSLIRKAAEKPPSRRKTHPGPGSRERRLKEKHSRSKIKKARKSPPRS